MVDKSVSNDTSNIQPDPTGSVVSKEDDSVAVVQQNLITEESLQETSAISMVSSGANDFGCDKTHRSVEEIPAVVSSSASALSHADVCVSEKTKKMEETSQVTSEISTFPNDQVQDSKEQILGVTSDTSTFSNKNVSNDIQNKEETIIDVNSDATTLISENLCDNDPKDKKEEESLRVTSATSNILNSNVNDSESTQMTGDGTPGITCGTSMLSSANVCGRDGVQNVEEGASEVTSNISMVRTKKLNGLNCDVTSDNSITSAIVSGGDGTEMMDEGSLISSSERTKKLDEGNDEVTSDANMLSIVNICDSDKSQKMEEKTLGTASKASGFSSANVCNRTDDINATPSNHHNPINPVKKRKLTGAERRRLKVERAIAEGRPLPPKKKRPAKKSQKKNSVKPTSSPIQKNYSNPSDFRKAWCDPSLDEFIQNTHSVSYPSGRLPCKDDSICSQFEPKSKGMQDRMHRVPSNSFPGANSCGRIQQNYSENVLPKSLKQGNNVNFPKKRRSGSQRKKQRKAYTEVMGRQMLAAENNLPWSFPKRDSSPVMWPSTQSRDYGPSNPKHARYDVSISDVNTSAEAGLMSFESFDRPMISYSSGGTPASLKQVENFQVAIIPIEYPRVKFIKNDCEVIERHLIGEIASLAQKGSKIGPKFEGFCSSNGFVSITCQNKETEDWLLDQVLKMDLVNGIKIKAGDPKQVLSVCKVSVFIPKPLNNLPVQNILLMLRSQNRGLRTLDWDVINRIEEQSGQTLILGIDYDSQKMLEKMNYKAYMGLTMINFRDLTSDYHH